LVGVLALFEVTTLDLVIQDRLFDFETSTWLLDAERLVPRVLLHELPTVVSVVTGLGLIHWLLFPKVWRRFSGQDRPDRRPLLCALLTLTIVPLLIGAGKQLSNMYCPAQIERYGGEACYVRLFERHPPEDSAKGRGHCFPAGHASGPFALVGLAAIMRTRRATMAAFGFAFVAGWIAGGYQIVTGSHYVSHTLVTMLVAWIVFLLMRRALGLAPPRQHNFAPEMRELAGRHGRVSGREDR
jgi:membrane-associated PAP2 superfamily phosphatase